MLDSLNLIPASLINEDGEIRKCQINAMTALGMCMLTARAQMLGNLNREVVILQTAMLALRFRP